MTTNPDRVNEPQPHRIAAALEHAAATIRTQGRDALDRAHDWTTTGNSSGGNNRKPKGDHSDPTATTALNPQPAHGVATWHQELITHLDQLDHTANQTLTLIAKIVTVADLEERAEQLRQPGTGYCECCAEWVPGTPDNRIVKGFCPSCRRAWDRQQTELDRSDFIHWHRQTHNQGDPA